MAILSRNDLTTKGVALIAKTMQGGAPVKFTKLTVGDGEPLDQASIKSLEDVVSRVKDVEITKLTPQEENSFYVAGSFSNQEFNQAFFWKELGLFAIDPDEGEIMFAYGAVAEDDPGEFISPAASGALSEKLVGLVVYVGGDAEVELVLGTNIYVTKTEFDDHSHDAATIDGDSGPLSGSPNSIVTVDASGELSPLGASQPSLAGWGLGGEPVAYGLDDVGGGGQDAYKITLAASGWSNDEYTITDPRIPAPNFGDVWTQADHDASPSEAKAYRDALITPKSQAEGSVTLYAHLGAPQVDVPALLVIGKRKVKGAW